MAKLSVAQDKAIRGLSNGEFPLGTNERTIKSLVNNGYVTYDNTFYDLDNAGREYLGVDDAVSEIMDLLQPVGQSVKTSESRPFAVQRLTGDEWLTIKREITWGTANVKRNRFAANGETVRVRNLITEQVWA